MSALISIESSADGEAFLLYVEHFLCLTLKRGQIVVMDTLLQMYKKMRRVRELIKERDCSLVFLVSYSPNFNHIEEPLSKTRVLVGQRRKKFRSVRPTHRLAVVSGEQGGRPRLLQALRLRVASHSFIMKTALTPSTTLSAVPEAGAEAE